MSKKYNQGAPKRRVIVAAHQEVKQRVRKAEFKGMRRGLKIGAKTTLTAFREIGFWGRIKLAFKPLDA